MRDIEFRGQRVDNGEWVHGNLLVSNDAIENFDYLIIPSVNSNMFCSNDGNLGFEKWYKVIPETIGQFTGKYDKNGVKIYEGNICNCREYECYGKVEWNNDEAGFYYCVINEDGTFEEELLYDYADELEVIGNIHDNPELLTEQN